MNDQPTPQQPQEIKITGDDVAVIVKNAQAALTGILARDMQGAGPKIQLLGGDPGQGVTMLAPEKAAEYSLECGFALWHRMKLAFMKMQPAPTTGNEEKEGGKE